MPIRSRLQAEHRSRQRARFPRALAALGAVAAAVIAAAPSRAQTPDANAEFLAALREAGYNDTAADFLEWVGDSPLATEQFRAQLPYERAAGLAAQALATSNRTQRAGLLTKAAENFAQFAAADPDSDAALDALRQGANLYAELALMKLADAAQQTGAAAEAERRAALVHFARAEEVGRELAEACESRLGDLPKPAVATADAEVQALRSRLRDRQAEARYLLALLSFKQAGAYDAESTDQDEALSAAWARFGELVEEYPDSAVAASSRFYQGRCAQEQGEFAKALGCYEDLTSRTATREEFRPWTARAYRRQAECMVALEKPADAIRICKKCLAEARPAERDQAEWLEVAYVLAEAQLAQAKSKPGQGAAAKRTENEIRELLRTVAAKPNEFQLAARRTLSSMTRASGADASEYRTFADALAAGKAAVELMNSSLLAVKVAEQNNPEGVEELQRDAASSKDEALRAFEAALGMADAETPIAEVNATRFYLAVLLWEVGRIEEAAVLGEFVASRYPESEFGPGAAKLALAAWEKLYQQSRSPEAESAAAGKFAGAKLAEAAQLIATRWPSSPEGAAAVSILINVAIRDNRIDQAERLLAQLPEESRAGAELSLGSALWTQYLSMTKDRDAEFDEASIALREKAGALLARGFDAARQRDAPTTSAAVGALYLVQLHLAGGDWQAAAEVLEDKRVGPLTLVTAKSDVASQAKFVLETYKVALRVYLSTQPPQREKAQAMMQALDALVAREGGAAEQVMGVYVGVGLQLQRQLKALTAAGNHLQAQQVALAFGDVLDRMAARPDAASWTIQNWIGQTNYQIGQGLQREQALAYLRRARTAYEAVLAAAPAADGPAPDARTLRSVRKNLGDCLVALGEHQGGIDQYVALLRENQAALDVQTAAATAYQAWGAAKRLPVALNQSIQGAVPLRGGKNVVWGWLRIASAADGARRRAAAAAASDPKAAENAARFGDLFFEARYHIAQARLQIGLLAAPAERRALVEAARQNVESMRSLYPDRGGPKWKAAFDAVLAQINQELAKP
ncbi:MAG TPA: hypothetical protein VEQ85_08205 [Lacipirellulaceae bacterium]|nr:hypothetical protein [Lacipirellulaceae bacterium]